MMKLQIALDLVDTNTALKMVEKIQDIIDIVEIGTPMIVKEGMAPVKGYEGKVPLGDGSWQMSRLPMEGPLNPDMRWMLARHSHGTGHLASDQTIMGAETPPTKRDEKFMWICSVFPMWWRVQKSWTPWGRLYRRTHRL